MTGALTLLPILLCAQYDVTGGLGSNRERAQPQQKEKDAKNLITLDEISKLDQKFHSEFDAAQQAEDGEKFAEAEKGFTQLSSEVDDLLKRIAVSVFPKNSFITVDGVKQPVTIPVETEFFGHMRDKAEKGKAEVSVLEDVTGLQNQADDLLKAKKYPDDVEMYKKAAELLGQNKTKVRDENYTFFLAHSVNGEKEAVTSYWSGEFGRLRDQYNKSTDDKLAPEQVRSIIRGVMKEINDKGYLDPAKHPDMPQDARNLFQTLADAGNKYLSQFQQ
ncbi:MAG TPA: hypothetical protein VHC90_21485 [Bryobacteraceae bacterium]|nr:hypothetical protein [Bryobacteraceae bacterium]